MKKVFLAWQDPQSRHWFPIGQLVFDGQKYHFTYTYGVEKAQAKPNFQLLHSFPEKDRVYTSSTLFPLFANRLMRSSRPDYQDYIKCLNIPQQDSEPITILARSGGHKATDTYTIFPYLEKDEHGAYNFHFFIRGLRYMPPCSMEKAKQLQVQESLYLTHDLQNPYDANALFLRTEDGYNLGYCPRYLTTDIIEILKQNTESVCVCVERINLAPTPIQFRVLCKMKVKCSDNFTFFSSRDYQSIVEYSILLK